jgi:hypothetical protein
MDMLRSSVLVLICVVGVSVGSASAAPIMIDSFNYGGDATGPLLAVNGFSAFDTHTSPAALNEVIGGYRTSSLTLTDGLYGVAVGVNAFNQGELAMTTSPSSSAQLSLQYAGDSGTGFAPIDLTDGGLNDRLALEWTTIDFTGLLTIGINSGADRSEITVNTLAGPFTGTPTVQDVLFTDFVGSANLSAITSIDFTLDGALNGDYILDSIAAVPEPATMGLLLMGSLAALRRRRR